MHLTLHLTRACQLRCDYCYAPPRPEPGMRLETAIAALDLGLRENTEAFGLAFFGGEPLLHKDLIRSVVAHGKAQRAPDRPTVRFKITTNGVALDDDFLAFAVREGLHVALSLDGVREAHEAHRRFPDGSSSFDRTLDALRRLLKVRPYSLVHAVVNPDTAPLMAESASFLLDEGVRYLTAGDRTGRREAAGRIVTSGGRRIQMHVLRSGAGRRRIFIRRGRRRKQGGQMVVDRDAQ